MQMGVTVVKVNEKFEATVQEIKTREPMGAGPVKTGAYGFAISPNENASIKAVNFLLDKGEKGSASHG